MSKKSNCCLSDLLILILIVLQFTPRESLLGTGTDGLCHNGPEIVKPQAIDNSILFLVALYYLCCCKKC